MIPCGLERPARKEFVPMRLIPLLVFTLLVCSSCRTGAYANGQFSKGERVNYQLVAPGKGWTAVGLSDNDLAYRAVSSPHFLAVNSTCHDHNDPSLQVLTQHLLIGFTERIQVSQEPGMLDGREQLRSHYRAKLDGVPVELLLVVMKKDGCVYDFSFVSPVGRVEEKRGEFESMLASFRTVGPAR